MASMSIWKEIIILRWDGVLPEHQENEVVSAKRQELGRLLSSVADPKIQSALKREMAPENILAKHYASITKDALPHIHGFAKYNKRMRALVLALSKQNLQRVYRQFGQIPVQQGYHLVQALKERLAAHKQQVDIAVQMKTDAGTLRRDVAYKLPPLAAYQHQGVSLLCTVPRLPLFADCGVGKTFMALVSTEYHIKTGAVARGKTLICGKLATLHSGWLEDAQKFTDLKVACLWLSTSYKKKEKVRALLESDADVFLINHDGVKTYEKELAAKRFEKVIVDESTVLCSFHSDRQGTKGSSFGRALMSVAEHATWRVVMSGTPAPNGPQDLWGQFKFLDPDGFVLEKTFGNFRTAYMEEKVFGKASDPLAPRTWIPKPTAAAQVKELITPLSFRVKIRDHLLDLPELTVMQRRMPLSDEQEAHYKELAERYVTEIDDKRITVTMALSLMSKFRQITGGFLYDSEKNAHLLENPKLDALDSLVLDEIDLDQKIIVYAQYEHEITSILARYKDLEPLSVYGGNSAHQNIENIQSFVKDSGRRLIVLHPRSAAHGITFTVAHYMIFYATSFSAEEDYQSLKRMERAGQKCPMFAYYLSCENSIDEVMYSTLQVKKKNQEALLDQGSDDETAMTMWLRFNDHLKKKYPKLYKKRQGG